MSNEVDKDSQKKSEEPAPAEKSSKEKDTGASVRNITEDDLAKAIKNEDAARFLKESLRSNQIALLYIDARSGGNFFSGDTKIAGDAISGERIHKTNSTGPVSGPVHTGSGDLHDAGKVQSHGKIVDIGRVADKHVSKIRAVYVTPATYDRAAKILAEQHVLLIRGEARHGKWTTAIHLLSERQVEEIVEIKPDISVDEINSIEPAPNAGRGYVIDTLTSESAEKLKPYVLKGLSNKLRERQSYLVITVDSRVANLSREDLSNYLVDWQEVPDRAKMLDKHLAHYLSGHEAASGAHDLSQAETVQQLFRSPLLPGEVDRLAELLSRVACRELGMEEAMARFEARAQQQVEAWFEEHADLGQRTFMISLAVFNGANYEAVLAANQRLQSLLNSASPKKETAAAESVFDNTRSRRVKEAHARIIKGYIETESGRSPVDLVELDNPSFQPAVLRYVWREYDLLHEPLLEWLRGSGLEAGFDIRARAAAAAGALSKYDFAHIQKSLLLPWANHEDGRMRAAAALALGIPIWEGEFAPQVLNLVHHWSTLDNWRLCWTATAAYGGLVGLRFPDLALRDLYNIAQRGDLRLLGMLHNSVINLFQAGQKAPDYYLKVIGALNDWTVDPRARMITLTGLLIFFNIAVQDKVETGPQGPAMPTLLWLADENEVCCDGVISLWRRALNNKTARDSALEALRNWLFLADTESRLYPALEKMMLTMAAQGTAHERERLCFYFNRWATHPRRKSDTSDKILSALNGN